MNAYQHKCLTTTVFIKKSIRIMVTAKLNTCFDMNTNVMLQQGMSINTA